MGDFHPDISLVAGDDWVIEGTLLADDGTPLDLTNGTFSWRLLDSDGNPASLNATIKIVPPATAGKITIEGPYAQTAGLTPGFYIDTLRADLTGGHSTLWSGRLLVSVNVLEPVLGY
jgi:hypothetical protein